MNSLDIEQGTEAWATARRGKVTASRVADVIAKTKSGYSTSRANYAAQLVCERLTGKTAETYINAAMAHGTATEPEARAAYEFMRDVEVVQVGFIDHAQIALSGASPDGLVGEDGLLEVKCPQPAAHLETLLDGEVPTKYLTQIYWQMACTGRTWADYVSYSPSFPDHLQLFIKRVPRNDARIRELEAEVVSFLGEVEATIAALSKLDRKAA